MRIRRRTKIPA